MLTALATELRFQCLGPQPGGKQCTCTMSEKEGIHRLDDDLHFCSSVCEDNYDALVRTQERCTQRLIAHVCDEMNTE